MVYVAAQILVHLETYLADKRALYTLIISVMDPRLRVSLSHEVAVIVECKLCQTQSAKLMRDVSMKRMDLIVLVVVVHALNKTARQAFLFVLNLYLVHKLHGPFHCFSVVFLKVISIYDLDFLESQKISAARNHATVEATSFLVIASTDHICTLLELNLSIALGTYRMAALEQSSFFLASLLLVDKDLTGAIQAS